VRAAIPELSQRPADEEKWVADREVARLQALRPKAYEVR
jgi:hypothetical protein